MLVMDAALKSASIPWVGKLLYRRWDGMSTITGKIDGSTLTFLLGLTVGYILKFIRDSIQPPKSQQC
jgi:hypothetical protein